MALTAKSVRELKFELDKRGIDYAQCREKRELQELLNNAFGDDTSPATAKRIKSSVGTESAKTMTIQQLKAGLRARGVDFSNCHEKQELVELLTSALHEERSRFQHQQHAQALASAGFAIHSANGAGCWIEGVTNNTELICHWDDGTMSKLGCASLDPVIKDGMPRPLTFDGTFEDAREEAFHTGKILIAHIRSTQRCKSDCLFELVLSSQEVRSLFDGNAIFWSGCVRSLKATHADMLTLDGSASLAMILPLAKDAMRVLSVVPLANKDAFVNYFLDSLEALREHLATVEARLVSENALLRQEQDEEFLAALAVDQAVETEKQKSLVPVDAGAPDWTESEDLVVEEQQKFDALRRQLAEKFETLPTPVGLTSRIMIRLPAGERVERAFSADTPLSCVYDWAKCCDLLPEGCGRSLSIPSNFEFRSSFPQRRFTRDQGEVTLADLGLVPSAALLIIDNDA